MRSGACLLLVTVVAAGAAAARAVTTTVATTTSITSTTSTTLTTTATVTTTVATPTYAPLAPVRLKRRCVGAGGVLVRKPGVPPFALDTPGAGLGPSGYPADASVIAFAAASGGGSTCRTSTLSFEALSLFDGAVTAESVALRDGRWRVAGLELKGRPARPIAGRVLHVGDWGVLSFRGKVGSRLSAALVLRLRRRHGRFPAGTELLVGFAEAAPPANAAGASKAASRPALTNESPLTLALEAGRIWHRTKATKREPQPLKATPPLGPIHYVFPVDGGAYYGDTYGATRSDISDGWHHGDDLWAPLGTPLVAVANGTLTLVGWNRVGGWRLWLTDAYGNSFYYAHLAGYSRWILRHRHVEAGEVVGFLGRTGDAFTTVPHLHFEIHPYQLLRLGYDGAVDPTRYLHRWRIVHVPAREIPQPGKPVAPRGTPRRQAKVVWRQLLVARHLGSHHPAARTSAPSPAARAELRRLLHGVVVAAARTPAAAARVAAPVAPSHRSRWPIAVAAALLSVLALGLLALRVRRRPGRPSSSRRPLH